ncbi:hypothetical protein IAU60_001775 [Kwoniella sp. DSM 27419]
MSASSSTAASQGRRSVTAIVAATTSNGIGLNGGLPWRLPGEIKYFARVTTGESPSTEADAQNALIMGRKTWESIPAKFRPLKDRRNLVVSRGGVDVADAAHTSSHTSLPAALDALPTRTPRTFLIGGAQLYTAALTSSPPMVDRVLLTRVLSDVECDTFLEDFTAHTDTQGRRVWRLADLSEMRAWLGWEVEEEREEKGIRYRFEMWVWDGEV